MEEKIIKNQTEQTIQGLLGKLIDINSVDPKSNAQITGAAFELYKATGQLVVVVANIYSSIDGKNHSLTRYEGIRAGLLTRIAKFMMAILQLSIDKSDQGVVILSLNRSIYESVINLRFLIKKDDPEIYNQFIEFSLGPERELYSVIQENIKTRGRSLPVEDRMLSSIRRVCRLSGHDIEKLKVKYGDWGGGLREKLKAINFEAGYLHLQRIPSHSAHGSWADLAMHYLEEYNGGFRPRSEFLRVDPRFWMPTAIFVIDGLKEYLNKYFSQFSEVNILNDHIKELSKRIGIIDGLHEKLLAERQSSKVVKK